jgi:predicted lipoprotein with Yx(FWY)xxD motif
VIPGKRTTVVTLGLLAALTLPACGGGYQPEADGYGNAGNEAAPAPDAGAAAAANAAPTEAPPAAAAPVGIVTNKLIATSIPRMGKVVTDAKGWVLYRFDEDTAKPPTTNCSGTCAQVWPPVLTDGAPTLQGIDGTLVGTVTRDDGAKQVTLGGWPLYRYVGDPKPGAWKGQAVSGTWFVSAPNGKKNLTCLPTVTPTPAAPPSPAAAGNGGGGSGGDGYGGGDGY